MEQRSADCQEERGFVIRKGEIRAQRVAGFRSEIMKTL